MVYLMSDKGHGWRNLVGLVGLVGHSPWGRSELGTTERLHFQFSCTREGNGNPLQFLPGESQGQGSLMHCRLWGCTESDTTEAT